jgi:hypothetical protein
LVGGICVLFLVIFGFYEDYVYILYLLYGPSMVSFTYIFSFIFKKEGTGQTMVILVNLLIGALGGTAVFIMRIYDKLIIYAKPIANFFRIIPSFCFCYGYNSLLNRYFIFATDYELKEGEENIDMSWSTAYLFARSKYKDSDILKIEYLGSDLIYLAVESIVYLLLLVLFENSEIIFAYCFTSSHKSDYKTLNVNNVNSNSNGINLYNSENISNNNNEINISIPNNVEDTYVKNEIIKAKQKNDLNKYAIKIISLIKTYYGGPFGFKIFNPCFKSTKAVRDISLCLEYGECFGWAFGARRGAQCNYGYLS